ncbi:MAG: hypothetical protein J7K26_01440 [Candidatus Aenigmarchaeota archaeon]|nr:hypothetical protein [Candidatus Aenigmarchaeota archaeon]
MSGKPIKKYYVLVDTNVIVRKTELDTYKMTRLAKKMKESKKFEFYATPMIIDEIKSYLTGNIPLGLNEIIPTIEVLPVDVYIHGASRADIELMRAVLSNNNNIDFNYLISHDNHIRRSGIDIVARERGRHMKICKSKEFLDLYKIIINKKNKLY